jgi:putative acetyltransferase
MFPSSTKTSATDFAIRAAAPGDIPACRELFVEYQRSLGVSLCFQGFDRELEQLPGDYVPPRGGLWLASIAGALAGCVALRPIGDDAGEMKRLYVRPDYRGRHLGETLARHVIDTAQRSGCRVLKLDTLPTMREAQRLYERLGFVDTPPYNDNPVDGVRFLALAL